MARWSAAQRPASSAEAYAIQDAVAEATGSRSLKRGEVVITGTCTGLSFVPPGASIAVEIGEQGMVSSAFLP